MSAGNRADRNTALAHAAPLVELAQRDARSAEATAMVFRTLGNAVRLRLLSTVLREGPMSRAQLGQTMQVSRALLVHHVSALEQDGFLTVTYVGREAFYEAAPELLATLANLLQDDAIDT